MVNQVGGIDRQGIAAVFFEDDFPVVIPEVTGVVIVGQALAVVPIERVESLMQRVPF